MGKNTSSLELTRALDRLKVCAEGQQKKVCLTSKECEKVCAYIWWLTDMYAHAKAKEGLLKDGRADS